MTLQGLSHFFRALGRIVTECNKVHRVVCLLNAIPFFKWNAVIEMVYSLGHVLAYEFHFGRADTLFRIITHCNLC